MRPHGIAVPLALALASLIAAGGAAAGRTVERT
jgi:hypothetical protein